MRSRKPRKLKKIIKKTVIFYDLAGAPKNMSMHELIIYYKATGIILYDGQQNHKPRIIWPIGRKIKNLSRAKKLIFIKEIKHV